MWDEIHHESDHTLDPSELPLVLTGDALVEQQETIDTLQESNCYWNFTDLAAPVITDWQEISANEYYVTVDKHWDANLYCNGRQNHGASFDDPF